MCAFLFAAETPRRAILTALAQLPRADSQIILHLVVCWMNCAVGIGGDTDPCEIPLFDHRLVPQDSGAPTPAPAPAPAGCEPATRPAESLPRMLVRVVLSTDLRAEHEVLSMNSMRFSELRAAFVAGSDNATSAQTPVRVEFDVRRLDSEIASVFEVLHRHDVQARTCFSAVALECLGNVLAECMPGRHALSVEELLDRMFPAHSDYLEMAQRYNAYAWICTVYFCELLGAAHTAAKMHAAFSAILHDSYSVRRTPFLSDFAVGLLMLQRTCDIATFRCVGRFCTVVRTYVAEMLVMFPFSVNAIGLSRCGEMRLVQKDKFRDIVALVVVAHMQGALASTQLRRVFFHLSVLPILPWVVAFMDMMENAADTKDLVAAGAPSVYGDDGELLADVAELLLASGDARVNIMYMLAFHRMRDIMHEFVTPEWICSTWFVRALIYSFMDLPETVAFVSNIACAKIAVRDGCTEEVAAHDVNARVARAVGAYCPCLAVQRYDGTSVLNTRVFAKNFDYSPVRACESIVDNIAQASDFTHDVGANEALLLQYFFRARLYVCGVATVTEDRSQISQPLLRQMVYATSRLADKLERQPPEWIAEIEITQDVVDLPRAEFEERCRTAAKGAVRYGRNMLNAPSSVFYTMDMVTTSDEHFADAAVYSVTRTFVEPGFFDVRGDTCTYLPLLQALTATLYAPEIVVHTSVSRQTIASFVPNTHSQTDRLRRWWNIEISRASVSSRFVEYSSVCIGELFVHSAC